MATLINANPRVYDVATQRTRDGDAGALQDDAVLDPIDALEIFDLIRNITDPEHPLTLEQLNVVQLQHITVSNGRGSGLPIATVEFTPTIPHCSMATLIGLCIHVRLLGCLPVRFKIEVRIRAGTHQSEFSVNKQLSDKERVAAALENDNLQEVVSQCLATAVLE